MKVLILGIIFFLYGQTAVSPDCDGIEIETIITHTSEDKNNGKIDVTVMKGNAPFRVFLFASNRSDNKLDVKLKDLKDLKSGEYILIIQDKAGCNHQETIRIN